MSFDSIIGQPFAVGLCRTWLKQNTTNPLLLYGPEGVGKKSLGLEVAKALNCQNAPDHDACNECVSCRKITAGHHPDVRVIDLAWQAAERGEPIEKQQNLRIETIMTERQRLLQSPGEGSWKVSIIDDAHRLTPDAANVLLKILEEPPAHTAIFLITPFRDRLFATIVSRCQPVRFRTLSDEEMGRCLTHLKVPADMHAQLMEMALGSPGRALHLNREEQIEAIQGAERLWQTLGQMTPVRVMQETGARKTSKPNRAEIEGHIHSLLMPAARALRAGDPGATEPVRVIQRALTQLRQNVQPALVYDYLLLQLAKAKK
jgi:DNA polymerase III delta' subunit